MKVGDRVTLPDHTGAPGEGKNYGTIKDAEVTKVTPKSVTVRQKNTPENAAMFGEHTDTKLPRDVVERSGTIFGRIATEARQRRQARQAPNPNAKPGQRSGHGNIIPDVIDLGIEKAARFAETGEKFLKKHWGQIRKEVEEEAPHLADRWRDVLDVARSILRKSRGPDGKYSESLFESAVGDVQKQREGPDQTIKQTIRDNTGRREEPKTVTASEALVARLRGEERAATKADREARKQEREKAEFELAGIRDELKGDAQRRRAMEGFKQRSKLQTRVAAEKARAEATDALKARVARIVNERLPSSLRGRYIDAAAKASTRGQLVRVVNRIRADLADYSLRSEIKDAARAARGGNPGKMLEANRQLYEDAKRELEALRSSYQTLKTITEKQAAVLKAQDIANQFKEAKHRQKADREVLVGGKVRMREDVVTQGVAAIEKKKALKEPEVLTTSKRLGVKGRVHLANLNQDSVGAMLGDKTLRRILSEDAWDGEDLVHADTKKADDKLQQLTKAAGYKWGSDELQRLSRAGAHKEADVVSLDLPDAGKVQLTPGELIDLRNTLTDPYARKNIENGAGITFERNKRGEETKLTAADVAAVLGAVDKRWDGIGQGMKNYLESDVQRGVFKAFRDQVGYDLEKYPDYWPTRRNYEQPPPETLVHATTGETRKALENLGFVRERSPDRSKPYLIGDAFSKFREHTYQAAVMTHMTSRVRTAEMIFKDPRMRKAIESRFGADTVSQIDRFIENMKLIFSQPKTRLQKAGSAANKSLAKGTLTLNPRTALKQLGGVFKLAAEVDPRDLADGVAHAYSADVSRLLDNSAYFRNRYEDAVYRRLTPSLGERGAVLGQSTLGAVGKRALTLNPKKLYGSLQDLTDRIELLNKFDKVSSRTAIAARLHEAERLHPDWSKAAREDYAVKAASYDIRRTNNTSSVLDMSSFAEGHRGDLFATAALMYKSDVNKSYNMLVQGYHTGGKKGLARAALAVGLNNAWTAAVTAGFAALLTPGSEEQKTKAAGKAAVRELVSNAVPLYGADAAGDLGMLLWRAYSGDLKSAPDVSLFSTPLASTIEDAFTGVAEIAKGAGAQGRMSSGPDRGQMRSDVEEARGLKKLAQAGLQAAGVPVVPLWKMIDQYLSEPKREPRARR